jgi:cyanophycinase-like exopeptidase
MEYFLLNDIFQTFFLMNFRSFPYILPLLFCCFTARTQVYTSYLTGDSSDVVAVAAGGVCMMGGAVENDQAIRWFLNRCGGGDIVVLRTSGSSGYNGYFYLFPGASVNSVETIVCNSATASYDPYVLSRIAKAEGIWFAGGDQWTYISYWRGTPLDSTVRSVISSRNTVIGGISAGMAILGEYYYTAENGSILSYEALNNPYSIKATISNTLFISHPLLKGVITDTHFDDPDRRGRLMTFLARALKDDGRVLKGIACEEYTSICLDTSGLMTFYGNYPIYTDYVWIARAACGIADSVPETCMEGYPLRWIRGGKPVEVWKGEADSSGSSYFLLNTMESFGPFELRAWRADQSMLAEIAGSGVPCESMVVENEPSVGQDFHVRPQPADAEINIYSVDMIQNYTLTDISGKVLMQGKTTGHKLLKIDTQSIPSGLYVLRVQTPKSITSGLCIIQHSGQ